MTDYSFSVAEDGTITAKKDKTYDVGTFDAQNKTVTLKQEFWTELGATPATVSLTDGTGSLSISKGGETVTVADSYDDTRTLTWKTEDTTATYYRTGLAETWSKSSTDATNSYTFHAAEAEETLATITGIKEGSDFSKVTPDNKVITITENLLTETKDSTSIKLTGDYTLALGNGISKPTASAKGLWAVYDTRATFYASDMTDGYNLSVDGKTITYQAAKVGAAFFELTNLTTDMTKILKAYNDDKDATEAEKTAANAITLSGTTLTLPEKFLPATDSTLKLVSKDNEQYDIKITGDERIFTPDEINAGQEKTPATFKVTETEGTYKYTSESTAAYYLKTVGATTTIASKEAIAATEFTISGLSKTLGNDLTIGTDGKVTDANGVEVGTISGKTLTITNIDALAQSNSVALDSTADYTLALGDNVSKLSVQTKGSFNVSDTTATYTPTVYHNYEASSTANSFIYKKSGSGGSLTISGLKSGLTNVDSLISVEEDLDNKVFTVTFNNSNDTTALNFTQNDQVTLIPPADYTIKIGDDSITNAKTTSDTWTQTGTTSYTYRINSTAAYYKDTSAANDTVTLTYVGPLEATDNQGNLIVLSGVTQNPKGKVELNQATGTVTFTEQIGNNVVIQSTDGGNNDYLLDFDAKDTTTGFNYMDITATNSKDTVKVSGGKLSVDLGADDDQITVSDGTNYIINGGTGNDKLDITASNSNLNGGTGEDSITVNGNNNIINGGADKDTINISGTGNSVDAGAGDDSITFANDATGVVYFSAGSDTINYSDKYAIKLNSELDYEVDGNDIVITEGSNSLRVVGGKEKDIRIITANGQDASINAETSMEKHLTYNNWRRTAVTINGSAEAKADGSKVIFTAESLKAEDYSDDTSSIKASETMSEPIYIQGNARDNYIISNAKGNSIDGGLGNDFLYSGTASDTFVYRQGQGSDVVYRFKSNTDKVILLDSTGTQVTADDFNTTFSGNDIVFRFNGDTANGLTLKDPFNFNNATDIIFEVNGTNYTYMQSKAIYNADTTNGKRVTLAGSTEYAITTIDKAYGVTITNYSASTKITGIAFSDIKTTSYTNKTITLGLGDKDIVLQNAASNALNLNGTTVYVGANMVFNDTEESIASNFSLTSDATSLDKSSVETGNNLDINASYTSTVTLQGGAGDDTLIGGLSSDSLVGNGGADTFVYSGGKDKIADYKATDGDKISLASNDLLDFSKATFDDNNNLIINGTDDDNSLTIINDDDEVKISVIGADGTEKEYSYKSGDPNGVLNEAGTAIVLYANVTSFKPTEDNYSELATIDASNVNANVAVSAVDINASYPATSLQATRVSP